VEIQLMNFYLQKSTKDITLDKNFTPISVKFIQNLQG